MADTLFWTLADWQHAYRAGLTPRDLLPSLLASLQPDDRAWISVLNPAALGLCLQELDLALAACGGNREALPLYGVPFAVKDNIDVAGLPTTCACPAFATTPTTDAGVVARLKAAGAIVLGKTNLDQFATGLVGTRSPYGAVPNSVNPDYISGGSSAGSASVVARGLVPFALGTDTAGSGRVPAGFNNLVGLKPTRGWLSTAGVVPACRTLDCVSVFALNVEDADYITRLAAAPDAADPYSRQPPALLPLLPAQPVLGIPSALEWFGDHEAEACFGRACAAWEAAGYTLRRVDCTPLHAIAQLLYEGPWVAERFAVMQTLLDTNPAAINPVVHGIVDRARGMSAVDVFTAEYRRAGLAQAASAVMAGIDALLVPTTPSIYTQAEVADEPVLLNSRLGTWTNFVNLLDWCALALPAGRRRDGLPTGITLIAPAWQDALLAALGRRWQTLQPWTRGAGDKPLPTGLPTPAPADTAPRLLLAVVGAHLSGMPLNHQLTERQATLVECTTTASTYRLYALPGTVPPKPGLLRCADGAAVAVELWSMPVAQFGSFVAQIPAPLGIGTLTLADGRAVKGFICEAWAIDGARDITSFGGWRAFMAAQAAG